jgi:hypothetical protein
MKRPAVALLVVILSPFAARPADAPQAPTRPQVSAPSTVFEATASRGTGAAGRALGSMRDRISLVHPVAGPASETAPAWIEPAIEAAPCAVPGRDCGGSVIAGSPIKSWLCYRPTTAHALPWLRPHPYVGPVTGQFHCSPTACPECAGAPACAPWTACGKGVGLGIGHGRGGCRDGTCITPPDEAFAGYKFAQPLSPALAGRPAIATSTSYKPGVPPSGMAAHPESKNPTVLESLKRTFSKP